jgi:ribose transport system ATP-binding protein
MFLPSRKKVFLMDEHEIIVSLKEITKIYGHHRALNGVSFDLRRGEVHCLVGENGAGKSTLIKILSGAIAPDAGEICIAGQCFRSLNPRQAIELGISTIYQDAEFVDSLTVADNVFLGNEQSARFSFVVDKRAQVERAREIITTLHLPLDPSVLVEELSASQRQMLQITKALYRDARIIIMDEPTSSLGLEEKEALMSIIRSLRERGIGIIYISHYLEEIFEIGDRVTVLKDGSSMGTYSIGEITLEEVVRKMVGRDASAFFQRRRVPPW